MPYNIIDKLATKYYLNTSELCRVNANTKSSYGYIVSFDDPLFTLAKNTIKTIAGFPIEYPCPSNITDSTISALLSKISTYTNKETNSIVEGIYQVEQHRLTVTTIIGSEKNIEKTKHLGKNYVYITAPIKDAAIYVLDKNNFNLIYAKKNNEEYLYFYKTCRSIARVVL